MFGKSGKRQIEDVTFVQPLKSEMYFYTPIAYATNLKDSEEKKGKQVFTDSDLAIAGKLKLIFEREKMTWFEIKEEKARGKHFLLRIISLIVWCRVGYPFPMRRPHCRKLKKCLISS